VAVGHDERAAVLDELREIRVVVLRAGEQHLAAVGGLQVGLAGLQLLERLAQVGQDQVFGAAEADQLDERELEARDGGLLELAEAADLGHDAAEFVVLADGGADGLVGGVGAVGLAQGVEHVLLQLQAVVLVGRAALFVRHVDERAEELGVLDDGHHLQVLLEAAGDGAGLGRHLGVEEVVAALERPLEKTPPVAAGAVGHVVRRDVRRRAARRAQTDGEAARQVEQHLRHEIAGIAEGEPPLLLCLPHELVVDLLQQVFKVDEMLQIFHDLRYPLSLSKKGKARRTRAGLCSQIFFARL
jgi:hypothetical protein